MSHEIDAAEVHFGDAQDFTDADVRNTTGSLAIR